MEESRDLSLFFGQPEADGFMLHIGRADDATLSSGRFGVGDVSGYL
jgi:hypothetical protein